MNLRCPPRALPPRRPGAFSCTGGDGAHAYGDFSVGCDWDGSQCLAASWEITDPMAAYQGPFVLLASFMMTPP